jgi:hypothetical protein
MARLAARFAPGRRGLGSRFGAEGRIGGRRSGGVLGVLVEAGFQLSQAGLELGQEGAQGSQLGFEFGDPSLESLATWALGLGCAHTAGVRGGCRRFLPT